MHPSGNRRHHIIIPSHSISPNQAIIRRLEACPASCFKADTGFPFGGSYKKAAVTAAFRQA
jgi:hypothetical protein